ncbi:RNase E specificity factor CsrD [Vibrio algarum]|uniref:RNase E specificity factor CsrD n=1 Tax=Vibrio algarum TaxID=3020714 RepID=A0ABT4YMT3_9VIBR|nr:RNase E specificity factor CsrD [Vibrio sp. KJ40-1]MDB1122862.1 RNase E specificity factor CsrD [Vibrio sp. KJ40-1]
MRYTPTLKLSTRLTAFVTIIVIGAMFILFVGGTLTFRSIGEEYLNQQVDGIVSVIDQSLADDQDAQNVREWIPLLSRASNIIELELFSSQEMIYHYVNSSNPTDTSRLYEKSYPLEKNAGFSIKIKVLSPYLEQSHSFSALSSVSLAIALVLFCLFQGVNWLKRQLRGSELLEERGRMILAGRVAQHAKGDHNEWPYTASEALDVLIEELQDARQERSRFDTFIRTHTFLDQLTGAANRVLFDSKLESALQESGANGSIILFRIYDWDNLTESVDKQRCDEFIVEVGNVISNIVQRFPDVVFARYFESEFAVIIPHQNSKDISVLANQCVRQLDKVSLLNTMDHDNWCHIGITVYSEGERRGHILSEVETAVKSAQLQNSNNWSRFHKKDLSGDSRGSVRWRTLFDKCFSNEKVLVFEQPCYLINHASNKTTLLHNELFARIDDDGLGILKASRFMSAIEQVGYQSHMDQLVVKTILTFIKTTTLGTCYSINLNVEPFKDRMNIRWLRDELLQLTAETRSKLSFEFVEGQLVNHLDYMRPVVRMISGLGCEVIVGQAGRTITSTHYIKDLEIDYLKLHRSLVKKIEQRQENQLFIRSLVGACEGTNTQVIAVGVERGKEWNCLVELGVDGGQGRMFQAENQIIPKPEAPKVQVGRRNRWRKKF